MAFSGLLSPAFYSKPPIGCRDAVSEKRQAMTHVIESQDQVFAWLAEPATHGGAAVKRVDTHAAVGFFTAECALKGKRGVRVPFLDFSTLDRRKAACEAEVAVNTPFSPDIYPVVVAIHPAPDRGH